MDTDIFVRGPRNWTIGTYIHELIHVHQYAAGRTTFVENYYSALLVAYLQSEWDGTSFDPMKGAPEEREAYDVSADDGTGRFDVWFAANGAACLTPPPPVPTPPVRLATTLLFDTDQSVLKPGADSTLRPLLAAVRASAHPEVVGLTDSTGGRVHNLALSKNRADAVVAWFEKQDPSLKGRVQAKGLGVATGGDNSTAVGRAQNRRIEVHY